MRIKRIKNGGFSLFMILVWATMMVIPACREASRSDNQEDKAQRVKSKTKGKEGYNGVYKSYRDGYLYSEVTLKNGRKIYILGEGRLINLAAAEGHPSSVMDMSFANQALSAEYMAREHAEMGKRVYQVPTEIDKEIARLKLKSMGIEIDTLTPEQEKYLSSWEMGT